MSVVRGAKRPLKLLIGAVNINRYYVMYRKGSLSQILMNSVQEDEEIYLDNKKFLRLLVHKEYEIYQENSKRVWLIVAI